MTSPPRLSQPTVAEREVMIPPFAGAPTGRLYRVRVSASRAVLKSGEAAVPGTPRDFWVDASSGPGIMLTCTDEEGWSDSSGNPVPRDGEGHTHLYDFAVWPPRQSGAVHAPTVWTRRAVPTGEGSVDLAGLPAVPVPVPTPGTGSGGGTIEPLALPVAAGVTSGTGSMVVQTVDSDHEAPFRVRVYTSEADMIADESRPWGSPPAVPIALDYRRDPAGSGERSVGGAVVVIGQYWVRSTADAVLRGVSL